MNQVSLETWRKRIADQKANGLKVTAWYEKNNLSKHTLITGGGKHDKNH